MFQSKTMEVNTKKNDSGYLGIVIGPMYSGKTSRLLALYKNLGSLRQLSDYWGN